MPPLRTADAPIASRRLRLSPLTSGHIAAMAAWLEAALAPDWTLPELEASVAKGETLLVSDTDAQPIGAIVVRFDAPFAGAVCVPFIAIEPSRRYRGLGSEASLALERHLRAAGVERLYAPVPDGRGLAVYFWLRLGYRPLTAVEAPWPLEGLSANRPPGIWLARESA